MRSLNSVLCITATILSLILLSDRVYAKSFVRVCELEVGSVCDSITIVTESEGMLALVAIEVDSVNSPLMHTEDPVTEEYVNWYSLSRDTLIIKIPDFALNKLVRIELVEFNTEPGLITAKIFHQGNIVVSKIFR